MATVGPLSRLSPAVVTVEALVQPPSYAYSAVWPGGARQLKCDPLGGPKDRDGIAQRISVVSNDEVVQHIPKLLLAWSRENRTILYILVALVAGFLIGRYRALRAFRAHVYQNRGEALVSQFLQMNFGVPNYHLMNHITLQLKDGTTQVDHILISRFGVFVIETKHYKGWIFADPKDANWTQVLFSYKFKFQNPLIQNSRHVQAVQGLLDFLPPGAIKSVVVFTGEAEFKTQVPQGVFDISGLMDYLREQTVEVMSLNRVQFCVGRLETARLAISRKTDVEHVQSLQRRHGSTMRPRPSYETQR
jgi:hypothetical protein